MTKKKQQSPKKKTLKLSKAILFAFFTLVLIVLYFIDRKNRQISFKFNHFTYTPKVYKWKPINNYQIKTSNFEYAKGNENNFLNKIAGVQLFSQDSEGKPYYYQYNDYKAIHRNWPSGTIYTWENKYLKFYNQEAENEFNQRFENFNKLFELKSTDNFQQSFANLTLRPWEKINSERLGLTLHPLYFKNIETNKFEKAIYLEYMNTFDGFDVDHEVIVKNDENYFILNKDYDYYGLIAPTQNYLKIYNKCKLLDSDEKNYEKMRSCYKDLWINKYRSQKAVDKFIRKTINSIEFTER